MSTTTALVSVGTVGATILAALVVWGLVMLVLGLVHVWRGRRKGWWRVWEYRLGFVDVKRDSDGGRRERGRGWTRRAWRGRLGDRNGEREALVGEGRGA